MFVGLFCKLVCVVLTLLAEREFHDFSNQVCHIYRARKGTWATTTKNREARGHNRVSSAHKSFWCAQESIVFLVRTGIFIMSTG